MTRPPVLTRARINANLLRARERDEAELMAWLGTRPDGRTIRQHVEWEWSQRQGRFASKAPLLTRADWKAIWRDLAEWQHTNYRDGLLYNDSDRDRKLQALVNARLKQKVRGTK